MNNVITILIDSVFSECISDRKTKVSSTPFIDKLIKEGIYTPNMYSFGPYTNAATKGLFCSMPTLEDYGYYFGINGSQYNPYRIFKENGYETYGFYYPYYLISNKTKSFIDHTIYTSGFAFSALWRGNFEYYKMVQEQRKLNEREYKLLERFLVMMFELWQEFYNDSLKNEEARILLKEFVDIQNMESSLIKLNEQYDLFKKDSRLYIDKLLEMGMEHKLAQIDCVDFIRFADKKFIKKEVYKENKDIINYIQKRTKSLNRKNNKINYKYVLSSIKRYLETGNKDELRILYNWYCCFNTQKKMIKDTFKGVWQELPSARTQVRTGKKILDQRQDTRPFYMFFHFLEAHERITYFSYDRNELGEIKKEFEMAKKVAEGCGDDFKGSLIYQMALRYIDSCIEELFDFLCKKGLMNNTTVMIIADHGSSYTYFPVRSNVVNNFHRENYNIPMIIWQNNMKFAKIYDGLYSSMDAFPTLLDLLGMKKTLAFKGQSVREIPEGREYIITEFMGPGTPDMLTKQAWMSVRNRKYMLAYKPRMNQEFNRKEMVEAYNLENDYYEEKNIVEEIDFNNIDVLHLIQKIENRFLELCKNRDHFMNELDKIEL